MTEFVNVWSMTLESLKDFIDYMEHYVIDPQTRTTCRRYMLDGESGKDYREACARLAQLEAQK